MTVVIADDDVLTLSKLNMLFLGNSNFTVLASATTGEDTVEIIDKYDPDLLIADVEMPKPDGIEILRYIHENGLKTEVLILSNYNNFEYVHAAMREGALDYVLKDQLNEEFFNLKLKEIFSVIETKHATETNKAFFSMYLKQKYLINCLNGNPDEGADSSLLVEDKDFANGIHTIIRLQIVDMAALYEKSDGLVGQITNVINSILQKIGDGICVYMKNGSFVLLFTSKKYVGHASTIVELQKRMMLIENNLMKIFNLETFYTYEIFDDQLSNIRKFDQICIERMNQLLLGSPGKPREEAEHPAFLFRDELSLINAFYRSDISEIPGILEQIFQSAAEFGVDGVTQVSLELCKFGDKCKEQLQSFSYDALPNLPFPRMKGKNFVEELRSYFITYFGHIVSLNHKKSTTSSHSPHVVEAINYIHQNYAKEISLETMADHLHLSNVYFSHLFKAETGVSFSNYLCQYRISIAKELLKNTNLSIMEITQKIGFQNYNYFIQVFKKMVGTTPLKYRSP